MSETYIFFDVDGVLIDGYHANLKVRNRWDKNLEKNLGIKPQELTASFFEKSFLQVIVGKKDCKDALNEVLPRISKDVTSDMLIDYWFKNDSNVNKGVMGIVEKLSSHPDVKLFIATNQEHYRAAYLWNDLRFKDNFQDIYYSARLGCLKENPEYFKIINEELGLTGKEVLFFDDSEGNMSPARESGWNAVLFGSICDLENHPKIKNLMKEKTK